MDCGGKKVVSPSELHYNRLIAASFRAARTFAMLRTLVTRQLSTNPIRPRPPFLKEARHDQDLASQVHAPIGRC
jgi:hypothetical protein